MTSTAKSRTCPTPTARQKRVWDKAAPGYDRQIAFFEKIQFGGGREWLGEHSRGRVLEVAIGTGRSLPYYPPDATITGIELSPAMLAIARQRAADIGSPSAVAGTGKAESPVILVTGRQNRSPVREGAAGSAGRTESTSASR